MTSTQGTLGKYEIVTEVGRGGFAVVYQARDTTLDRVVALKVLAPHLVWDPTFLARFQREARIAANLKHPHIVIIHEIGEAQGQHYIAMEFLAGHTLKDLIAAQGALPLPQATRILEQIAGALDYAHDKGIIHRDVKPSNIMVDESGHATLTDFGLVRAAEGSQLTTSGQILGTPEYVSPEQAEGEDLDWRTDLYSLGVVLYEMATGQAPFEAPTPLAVLRGHTDKEPPRPSAVNPAVTPAAEAVILKALAKRREERYQSGTEMVAALRVAQAPVVEVEPLPPPAPVIEKAKPVPPAPPPPYPSPGPSPARGGVTPLPSPPSGGHGPAPVGPGRAGVGGGMRWVAAGGALLGVTLAAVCLLALLATPAPTHSPPGGPRHMRQLTGPGLG